MLRQTPSSASASSSENIFERTCQKIKELKILVQEKVSLEEQELLEHYFLLGTIYESGVEIDEDLQEAIFYYRLAADKNYAPAQKKLALMYGIGRGVKKNLEKAFLWLRKAAENDDAEAQRRLAMVYEQGMGVDRDSKKAERWFVKAAEKGSAEIQYELAVKFENGEGIRRSHADAKQWFTEAAKQNHLESQCRLIWKYGMDVSDEELFDKREALYQESLKYKQNTEVEKNEGKYLELLEISAVLGHPRSLYLLSIMYKQGKKVFQDLNKAMEYLKRAAHDGTCLEAMAVLGYDYVQDTESKIILEGIDLLKQAADQGYGIAQHNLGYLFMEGNVSVKKNPSDGLKYFKMAADQGLAISQYCVGRAYKNGEGVAENLDEARKYFEMAAAQNHESAKKELEKLQSSGSMVFTKVLGFFSALSPAPEPQKEADSLVLGMDEMEEHLQNLPLVHPSPSLTEPSFTFTRPMTNPKPPSIETDYKRLGLPF